MLRKHSVVVEDGMRGLIEWYNGVRDYEAASYPESVDDGMRLRIWMIPSNTN